MYDFKNKKIEEIIELVFGKEKLKEIKQVDFFKNETFFYEEFTFTPHVSDLKKNIVAVLDTYPSFYKIEIGIDYDENETLKKILVLLNQDVFFCVNNNSFYIGEIP